MVRREKTRPERKGAGLGVGEGWCRGGGGQRGARTTITGAGESVRSLRETLPISALASAPWPREPTTTRSAAW